MGSFLNVLIDRLPNEISILGRSRCDSCNTNLSWKDLFPFVSFIYLKAKCRYCSNKLSYFYPFMEFLIGVVYVVVWKFSYIVYSFPKVLFSYSDFILTGDDLVKVTLIVIISTFIVIIFADAKYHIIPDSMQFIFFIGSAVLILLQQFSWSQLGNHFLAGVVVMLPILFLYLITRGKGMGFGDVKLAYTMGFLLGIALGFSAIYTAFILGSIVGIIMIIGRKKKLKSTMAFGPCLIFGTIIMLFFGKFVVSYLSIYFTF
jgi:leader peptidase (prepilin peptidase) / N-methyltransferase